MFGHFLNTLESGPLMFMVRDLRVEDSGKGVENLSVQATIKVVLVNHGPLDVPEVKKK